MSGKSKPTPTQNTPQKQRGRSTSTKSNLQTAPKPAVVKPMKQSYASALATLNTQPKLIRNINIIGSPENIAKVKASLLTDTSITENGITSVKQKGKTNFTVFFRTDEGAAKTEERLKTNYKQNIAGNTVSPV